jgi:alpha-glucosidase
VPSRADGDQTRAWWRDAVVYQIYPRSFQDTDGDGVGDLKGIESRLDHLVDLGVDALWLSPIYPSPMADFGYDVADFTDVDRTFGTLPDFDALLSSAHARRLRLLMDLVPCHTSIEHRWFSERPDFYVWHEGDAPPNNWRSAFGGPAWTWHEGRRAWYLHSFYPEQPDLDWRNPDVVAAMQDVIGFWIQRGVDGFRLDAIDRIGKDPELRDDPPASGPPLFPIGHPDYAALDHRYSKGTEEVRAGLAALRAAAGDALLVGEVYLPPADWPRYLESLDTVFAFELSHAQVSWEAGAMRGAIQRALAATGRPSWAFSNHDSPRLPTRLGPDNLRVAAMLLLTLPGPGFLYCGDEIGLPDGPGADPPFDRSGRDGARHPMPWERAPHGGFTTGEPWLEVVEPEAGPAAEQRGDPESLLSLYRRLIALRPGLGPELECVDADPAVLAYRRGDLVVALNVTPEAVPAPVATDVVLATGEGALADGRLAPHAGIVARAA